MTVNKGSLAYKYISQTFLLLTETVWVLQIVQKRVPIWQLFKSNSVNKKQQTQTKLQF